jgi:outer membrane protein assembly factor BamA
VGWQLQRALNPDQTENLFLRYNYRQTGLTRLEIPDLVPAQDRHVRLSTLSATFIRDTRDNVLDAHKGFYQTAELDFTPSALGSNVDFARLLAQVAYYRNVGKNIIWANSLRIGLQQPFKGSHVPISEEFFSGGGSTLRGFPLNGAGPQRQIEICGTDQCFTTSVPTGGKQLFIVNSEFRIPTPLPLPLMDKLGIALFYDGGNVYERIGFHDFAANYTNTVGIGLRYATPLGPVRIDLGRNLNPEAGIQANLNPPPTIKAKQWFITLGQAF